MTFPSDLPTLPGVYRFYDETGKLIYVGKAKNLRRRLSQYKNAKRRKAHAKMRKINRDAKRLEFETCTDELTALRLETRLIQEHRPKWNVVGAFFFLYPMVGIKIERDHIFLCYTTNPDAYPGFQFHGAFRSRYRTREGFFALNELLRVIGHAASLPELGKMGYPRNSRRTGYLYGFRQVPLQWQTLVDDFFKGEDFSALEELSLLLLEHPSAVKKSKETEELLKAIRAFWQHEVQSLKRAREHCKFEEYPVPQKERDLLFISLRNATDSL